MTSIGIGDRVIVKKGASAWMKERNYWHSSFGHSIDGQAGEIANDYTGLPGDDSHLGVNLGFDFIVGVNPKWLELT